ncbi:MAG TPA: hypothetical protein VFJ88_05640, partial [Chthoniobacterales bacterium]|nr:hypothetical protein [Chthoniobacterales bacterium]
MNHRRLLCWVKERREKLFWTLACAFGVTVILLSCSSFDPTTRAIMAPPHIPGAEFVGSEKCADC